MNRFNLGPGASNLNLLSVAHRMGRLRYADLESLVSKILDHVSQNLDIALSIDDATSLTTLTGGQSEALVLLLKVRVNQIKDLRFVLRVHGLSNEPGDPRVRAEYEDEVQTLRSMSWPASRFLSHEFIDKAFSLENFNDTSQFPVVVLRHAADREDSELIPFAEHIAQVIQNNDVEKFNEFKNELSLARTQIQQEWRQYKDFLLPNFLTAESLCQAVTIVAFPDKIVNVDSIVFKSPDLIAVNSAQYSSDLDAENLSMFVARGRLSVVMRSASIDTVYAQFAMEVGAVGLRLPRAKAEELTSLDGNRIIQIVIPKADLKHAAPTSGLACNEICKFISEQKYYATYGCHGDLHCKNLLTSNSTAKVIDFYSPKQRIEGSDWARLAASLLADLPIHLPEELISRIAEIAKKTRWRGNDECVPAQRLFEILNLLAPIETPAAHDVVLANLVECSRYARYTLEGTIDESILLTTWQKYWAARAKLTGDNVDIVYDQPKSHETSELKVKQVLFDFWEKSFRDVAGLIQGEARRMLRAIIDENPKVLRLPLSHLQEKYLEPSFHGRLRSSNLILAAPTTTGKSTIARAILLSHLLSPVDPKRPCAIYIAPTKALTFAFYKQIQELVSSSGILAQKHESVIVSTGDDQEMDHRLAQGRFLIACVVNEKANAVLSRSPHLIHRVGVLVIDELHMIQEIQRGPILEVLLMKAIAEQADVLPSQSSNSQRGSIQPWIIGISTELVEDSATQKPRPALQQFFTPNSNGRRSAPPQVLRSSQRPVSVSHNLVFSVPTHIDISRVEFVEVTKMDGDQGRNLSTQALKKVQERLNGRTGIQTVTFDKHQVRGIRHSMAIDLCMRILASTPTGRTILIFTSSRRECNELARHLCEKRLADAGLSKLSDLSRIEFAKLIDATSEMETQADAEVIKKLAEAEIYIHNAEVPSHVRHEIERLFTIADHESPSRVLIATTTLAYGVNLAVNDVILEHLEFPTSLRKPPASTSILDDLHEEDQIEAVEFHNMAGRAGRLGFSTDGQAEARFFVLSPKGVNPLQIVYDYYRTETAGLGSRLFADEDRSKLLELDKELSNRWLTPADQNEDSFSRRCRTLDSSNFSYPFARSVLDILRHLSYRNVRISRRGGTTLGVVSPDKVFHFIATYSLLRHDLESQNAGEEIGSLTPSDQARHVNAGVESVLRDAAELGLVDSRQNGYSVSNLGEAMLETGTEFASVIPLVQVRQLIEKVCRECGVERTTTSDGGVLPAELYILAIVFQEDICRRYRNSIPEWRNISSQAEWPEDQVAANVRFVMSEFHCALGRIGITVGPTVERLADRLRTELDNWLANGMFRDITPPYKNAFADGGLRFFCCLVRWINFDANDQCKRILTVEFNSKGDHSSPRMFMGFLDYTSRLSYRARFLAALCVDRSSGYQDTEIVELERQLLLLSQRIANGCASNAVPLFWPRSSRLRRSQADGLIKRGFDAPSIARNGIPAEMVVGLNMEKKYQQLLSDISIHAANELETIWMELRPRTSSDEPLDSVSASLSSWVDDLSLAMRQGAALKTKIELREAMHGNFCASGRLSVKHTVSRSQSTADESSDEYLDEQDRRDTIRLEHVTNLPPTLGFTASGFLWRFGSDETGWQYVGVASSCSTGTDLNESFRTLFADASILQKLDCICCVIWPWLEEDTQSLPDVKGRRSDKSAIPTFFMSPGAYCLLWSFIARGFLRAGVLNRIASESGGEYLTIRKLIDEHLILVDEANGGLLEDVKVPATIRRDLLSVFEI